MRQLSLVLTAAIIAVAILAPQARADLADWSSLSVSAENTRLKELGVEFPDPGNAADLYLPYLTGKTGIITNPLFVDVSIAMIESPEDGDAEKMDQALKAAAADLDAVMAASRRLECSVWGVHLRPDMNKILFSQDTPEYLNLFKLALLLIYRGDALAEDGDSRGAELNYLAALRIGHHLESEPELFGYVVGLALKDNAAARLAGLYQNLEQNEKARNFANYADITSKRIQAKNILFQEIPSWKRETVERFVLDIDAPYALRFDTLVGRHYCLHREPILVRCALLGPPRWVTQLEDEFARLDDLSMQLVQVLQAHRADLRWLK